MTRRFTKILAALALLVFMTPSLVAWGQRETTQLLSEDFSTITTGNSTSTSGSSTAWTGNDNFPTVSTAYQAGGAVRLGSGSKSGSITSKSLTVAAGTLTVAFDVKGWSTVEGSIKVTAGSENQTVSYTATMSSNFESKTVNFTISEAGSMTVKLETTAKRAFLDNIIVTNEAGSTPTPTCADPTFSPEAGTFTQAQSVTISCATSGATIYYSTNGENPTTESAVYSSALTISETTTVKAMAVKEGMNNSGIVTAVYTIEAPTPVQSFSQIDGHNPVVGQTYLIVDLNTNKALTSANGTSSAPSAVAVTIENNKISTDNTYIQWTFEAVEGGYTIHPVGDNAHWLYTTTNSGNSVRVGTGTNKVWTLDITSSTQQYHGFKNNGSSFYLGVYNSQDWRGYSSINTNIENTQIALFVLGEAPAPSPSITASNVNIAYDATSGSIDYTITNPVSGQNLTASVTEGSWLTLGSVTSDAVPFTCAVNEGAERTATVTLSYEGADDKEVTVTQAAAPVIYTTIPALFEAATTTETNVLVTFNNWVVSGVSTNGKSVYVTDNTGNGFIIYFTSDMSGTFAAGNILSGTSVACKLKLYNGAAELVELDADDLTITDGGTVSIVNIAMASLSGVNTGALVSYENLTCSVDNNKYYLTDGTTTVQAYNTLYAFDEFEAGKTYNVTGVYVQYNTVKEIAPRSAADIEEVEVQHEEYTLTVSNLSHVNLFIFGGEESETIISTEDGENTAQVYDGTEVLVSIDVEAGYVFQSLTITDGNGAPVETEELTANEYYSFLMPTSNVTITATAVEPPMEATYIFNTDAGLQALGITKPASGKGTDLIANQNYTLDGVTMTCTHGSTHTRVWNNSGSTELRVYDGGSLTFTAPTNYVITSITFTGNTKFDDWSGAENSHTFSATGTMKISTITVTIARAITKEITANQWYLIASPVGDVAPTAVANMTTGSYALYRFDQQGDNDGKEWINYKNSTDGGFDLEFGKGYLYANQTGCTLTFTGTPVPFSDNDNLNVLPLEYNEGVDFAGYNLLGNPFNQTVWTDWDIYVMDENSNNIIPSTSRSIAPMQGFFVIATDVDFVVTLYDNEPEGGDKGASVALNVSRNRGNVIDRAIVRMGEGRQLPKFQLFEGSTKVYIPQGDQDYAVVRSEGQGELPVNFRASENGTYTLSMDVENMDMNYLHLIDNMTGMDVDLLQTPSYTFEAKVNDYESRFRLVFAANNEDGVSTGSTAFAFYSNGSWIINNAGEATLQVIDLTGRILSSETVNGSVSKTINAVPGVYMLRLINGENANVQKIVVR